MTVPLRQPIDSFVDTIRPVTATSTVMTSDIFGTLPTNLSPAWYVPAQIVDDSTGDHETVRIIGANGTTTATVQRGVEGTVARDWEQPVTIRCSPAVRDATMVFASPAAVPADLHVGARYATAPPSGESLVREQTARQGALPTVRAAPADFPRSLAGAASHDKSAAMRLKAIAFGPIITSPQGLCGVYWDGAGTPASYDLMVATENPRLSFVAAAFAAGYRTGSSSAWGGHIVISQIVGPPWVVQMICYLPNGQRLANQQVAGSLLVVGG